MDYSLSDIDVKKICPDCRVFSYPDISKMHSLAQLIDPHHPRAMILYQTQGDGNNAYGHWTSICMLPNSKAHGGYSVYFFDPYGTFPDNEQRMINKSYMERSGQVKNKLQALLKNSIFNDIHYNNHRLQKLQRGIDTCGRWSAFFLRCKMTETEFVKFIKTAKNDLKLSNDETIVILTDPFLN